ncbi:MAG TPA: hypothetical protein VFQ26_03840, partial [Nitrospiraceae bacterium]|nr:hypothetical protein [Nitrospiraceae bacterium]
MGDVFIPDDWDGVSYCCYAVQWPDSFLWRSVLNGLIDLGGTGWYYNEQTGSVISARDAIRATWEYNFKNEVVIMACGETTNGVLEGILAALQNIANGSGDCGCGSGSGGAGSAPVPIDPWLPTEGQPYPPEFESQEEFNGYKCFAAAKTVEQLIEDIQTISAIQLVGLTIATMAPLIVASILTPVPFDDVLTVAATILIGGLELTALYQFSSDIFDVKDDLICELFNTSNAEDAFDTLIAYLNDVNNSASYSSLLKLAVAEFIDAFVQPDLTNRIYQERSTWQLEHDCSGCFGLIWSINTLICTPTQVSGVFNNGEEVELESCVGNYFGTDRAGINSGAQPEEELERIVLVSDVVGGGSFYVTSR